MYSQSFNSIANISAQELDEKAQGIMRRVYFLMTLGLMVTAGTSFAVIALPALFRAVASYALFFIIAEFVVVLALSWALERMPMALALGMFFVYAILNGATLTLVVMAYTASEVTTAFLSTACLFGAMTIVGYTTKMDLTSMGGFLLMGLLGLVIGSVINIFLASDGLSWILTFAGIAIFIGLTAYDTQRIKNMTLAALTSGNATFETSVSVRGALVLYLDFINLFLRILQLFSRRR